MTRDLISVIVPNRSGEKNESLTSIKNQTYKKIEIIEAVDKNNKGAAFTRNQGLKKAKGEYIFFCDNDIELAPDCLENLYNTLKDNPQADWAFGKFSIDGVIFNEGKGEVPKRDFTQEFIDYFCGISTMSLVRAKCNPKMDIKMRRFDDWDLWITLTRKGYKPAFCNQMLFTTKNRPNGISMQNDTELWKKRLYKKHAKKIADIIIPHHDQHRILASCLSTIDNSIFNIIIVSGGTFAVNCNKGARLAETDNLIFLNDDTEPDNEILIKMVENENDITGIAQYSMGHRRVFYGIGFKDNFYKRFLAEDPNDVCVPSGFCFKAKNKVWKKLKGFDEIFKNGAEDIDLFLRAKEKKCSIGYLTEHINHHISRSEGRFDFADENDKILENRWAEKLFTKKEIKRKEKIDGSIVKNNFLFRGKKYEKGDFINFDGDTMEQIRMIGCV